MVGMNATRTHYSTTYLTKTHAVSTKLNNVLSVASLHAYWVCLLVNVYHITDYCPILSNVLPMFEERSYFNRTDVKKAIHAPLDVDWQTCTTRRVYNGDHPSPLSIEKVLPQVIEATDRVLIASGDWDALLPTNGTMLAIQNMTWNGKLGFQSAPTKDLIVPIPIWYPPLDYEPQGIMGKEHFERGLQWVEVYQAGHMLPQYQPAAAWRHLEWLLGRIDSL